MADVGFLTLWRSLDMRPEPVAEYRFHPTRRWRFDWAWPEQKVAVEFDGGQWSPSGGRHNRDSDREKLAAATALGWRVLRFSNQQWRRAPLDVLDLIRAALT